MEEKKGKCFSCCFFDRYYTKEEKHFQRTTCGWCGYKEECVFSSETCEAFKKKREYKRPKRVILLYLHELLTEISEVRNLIEDEKLDDEESEKL